MIESLMSYIVTEFCLHIGMIEICVRLFKYRF